MSRPAPHGSYDETILTQVDQAFRDVMTVLQAHDPCNDLEKDDDLRALLAEKLMILVVSGVSGQELRKAALETLPLQLGAKKAS